MPRDINYAYKHLSLEMMNGIDSRLTYRIEREIKNITSTDR